mgnify:CR=1 FL=1
MIFLYCFLILVFFLVPGFVYGRVIQSEIGAEIDNSVCECAVVCNVLTRFSMRQAQEKHVAQNCHDRGYGTLGDPLIVTEVARIRKP